MGKRLIFLTMVIIVLFACSKEGQDKGVQKTRTEEPGLVEVLKEKRLADFQSLTIGEAFDSYSYLTEKVWVTDALKSGHVIVDFRGWFKKSDLNEDDQKRGVRRKGLEVKFVIEPSGAYYVLMVSRLELISEDNIIKSEYPDIKAILSRIYSKQKVEI